MENNKPSNWHKPLNIVFPEYKINYIKNEIDMKEPKEEISTVQIISAVVSICAVAYGIYVLLTV